MSELVKSDVPPSDEVSRQELQTHRKLLEAQFRRRLKGYKEIDGVEPDEDHPDFRAKLLWKKIGEANKLYVYVIPVNEDLDPWGMGLREDDNPKDVLQHAYAYGTERGMVPETSTLDQPKAA